MLHCTMILEDTCFVANADDEYGWHVTVRDTHCDKQWTGRMTNAQFAAMCALAVGLGEEDQMPQNSTQVLYSFLDELINGPWKEASVCPVP